jgi:glucosyl-3-phosphoglycerate synthase
VKGGLRHGVARLVYDVRDWFERRFYDHAQFADPVALVGRKRELGLSVSVLLTCFHAPRALGRLMNEIHALNKQAPRIDQTAMIVASSSHSIDAACPGVEVYGGDELVPEYGPVIGKGDAMWRALSVCDLARRLKTSKITGLRTLDPVQASKELRSAK